MSREILFKGKTKQNKWVQGDLNCNKWISEWFMGQVEYVKVIPETVGQFTGLTDRNGVKIFEGDILEKETFRTTLDKVKVPNSEHIVTFVILSDIYGGYLIEKKHCNSDESFRKCRAEYMEIYASNCEVIGNIHDEVENER
jgi:uncharacterized phage protein (TIGR01671 family)